MADKATTRAQDFLSLVERTHRGHLKLYIGFATVLFLIPARRIAIRNRSASAGSSSATNMTSS